MHQILNKPAVIHKHSKAKSEYGQLLLVECRMCNEVFDSNHTRCPHCGWSELREFRSIKW